MTTENQNPNAQGPQTGADGQAQTQQPAPQTAGSDQNPGIQKRIDELTAKMYDSERRRESEVSELRQMNNQLLMAMANGATQTQQQVQQPVVEIDPELKKQMDAYAAPMLQAQKQQMANMMFQSGQVQLQAAIQGQHPEVAKRTQAIWADAVAKGAHINGFTPQQALTWARGELVDTLIADAGKSQQVRQGQNFNAQTQTLPTQSAVAPPSGTQQQAEPDLDEDPSAASAHYAQRLGNKTF